MAQAANKFSRLGAAALIACGFAATARADIYDYPWGFSSFPDCDSPAVIAKIHEKFAWSEAVHGYRGVDLLNVDRIGERRTEYFGPRPISRRYCHARAWLSNGKKVSMPYLIEEAMWVAGTHWNVQFCATGYDRWHVYGGYCRVLRR